jgi:hypothetical protein
MNTALANAESIHDAECNDEGPPADTTEASFWSAAARAQRS